MNKWDKYDKNVGLLLFAIVKMLRISKIEQGVWQNAQLRETK